MLMPPLTYIHASEAARTTAGGGGVAAAELPPPKLGYGRGKGRRGEMEMCPQGTQKSHGGAAACLVAYLYPFRLHFEKTYI